MLEGYSISQSGLYLRVQPRNSSTTEGKRHHRAAPVKLIRPQNSKRNSHVDSCFAAATVKSLRKLAEMFEDECVAVISQDDKARVPLGFAAATKQAPILMNLKYKVVLPDHDWVVAGRHKLIVSVYAALRFLSSRKLSYSGQTYIAIFSGKHDSSTAATNDVDFNRLMGLKSFETVVLTKDGTTKPILIFLVDKGPDKNTSFSNTLKQALCHFKTYDLDALFIAYYAPSQSTFYPVERRMAPLSRELSEVVLPYDHFGSHLNASKQTIDLDLKKQNFATAGEVLASLWNENKIDRYLVRAEYVPPPGYEYSEPVESQKWIATHVRQSQYLLQIVKCGDLACCSLKRSDIDDLITNRF